MVGSGPFAVAELAGGTLRLTRHEDYVGRTSARLAGLVYRTVADSATIEDAMTKGTVDVVWRGLDAAAITRLQQQVEQSPDEQTESGYAPTVLTGARILQLKWSPESRARASKPLRTAIAVALQGDRTSASLVPAGVSGHAPTFPLGGKATPKVTWKSRINLTLGYDPTTPGGRDLAVQIRTRLEDTGGLSVKLVPEEAGADLQLLDRKAWTATAIAWLQPYLEAPLPDSALDSEHGRDAVPRHDRPGGGRPAAGRPAAAERGGPGDAADQPVRRAPVRPGRRRGQHGAPSDRAGSWVCGASAVAEPPSGVRRGPLEPGERITLTDPKGRRHSVVLVPGAAFHTTKGAVQHDDLIAGPEGVVVTSVGGTAFLALRPLLNEFTVTMPRGAAVVYPKDAARILVEADIFPGARVVEAGAGSGALTCYLLRAVGEHGRVTSYERRDDFAAVARRNVEAFFGAVAPGVGAAGHRPGRRADRGPGGPGDPGHAGAVGVRRGRWPASWSPGGLLAAYVATTTQLGRLVETLRVQGGFTEPEATETLVRAWHAEGLAVRPRHDMVGHTGLPGHRPPAGARRHSTVTQASPSPRRVRR